jgi:hypothetical protein
MRPSGVRNDSARPGSNEYSNIKNVNKGSQFLTFGSNQAVTPRLSNEIRFNYARVTRHAFFRMDDFGGAAPPPDSVLYPSFASPQNSAFLFLADSTPNAIRFTISESGNNWQRQINVTDNLSQTAGAHQFKFGVDYAAGNSSWREITMSS